VTGAAYNEDDMQVICRKRVIHISELKPREENKPA
jgi:hypothetical protein